MTADKEVVWFFILFLTVYFLESIGGFYMTSAVVSIEKQFEIPSRMSGLMVSAGDFGYIPSVVFVSYFGGKGNRARWIGAGCLMIALANVLIAMSNFLFPVKSVELNSAIIESSLVKDTSRLSDSVLLSTFLDYTRNISVADGNSLDFDRAFLPDVALNVTLRKFADEHLSSCYTHNASFPLCKTLSSFLHHFNRPNATELSNIRILTASPFAFCYTILNALRRKIEAMRCSSGPSNMGPFIMIFGGLLILGVGRTMPYSLGLPLIDDNVKRQNLPLYFAGMFFIRILGPVLGFLIGGVTNNYYYSFDVPPGLTPRDPMWIGRWWAGFLVIGVTMFGPSLALWLYPTYSKYLVGKNDPENENATSGLGNDSAVEMEPLNHKKAAEASDKERKGLALVDRHMEKDEAGHTIVPATVKDKIEDFVSTVQTILRCPVYVGSMIGRIMDVFAFKGFFVFLPKYLEVQFGLPQYKISMYLGIIGVSGFAAGVIIGSVTMRKFKLQGRKAAGLVAMCSLVAALLTFANAMVSCKSATSLVADKSRLIDANFTTTCNSACDCVGVPLYPVCNRQGQAFYSPCHAGCPLDQGLSGASIDKVFRNCKCSNDRNATVSRNFCDQSICERKFVWYFVNMAVSGVFGGMGVIPAILILLRSVPPVDRSISLGFQGFLVSLLATLPSPVFWGWIVDKSCVLWNTVCGEQSGGACTLFDADKLRLTTHITYGIMRLSSLVTDLAVLYFAKGLILMDEEPVEERKIRKESHFASSPEFAIDIVVNPERKFTM